MTPLQKRIRKLGLVGISPLASGYDSLQGNGVRLSRNLRGLFFKTAEACMPCTRLRQQSLLDYALYKKTFGDAFDYNNFFLTADKSSLILHDPTVFALRALKEAGKDMHGILSAPHIMRVSTGGIKPLEKVKYFYGVPAFHFMCPRGRAAEGRGMLEKFCGQLLEALFGQFTLQPITRDVSHYAEWSLTAEVPAIPAPIGVLAAYQLSPVFSSALKMDDRVFFEVSVSSRLTAAVVGHYGDLLGSRFAFPGFLAPVAVNVVCDGAGCLAVRCELENAPFFFKTIRHAGGGTSARRKAHTAQARNGAPLTLFAMDGKTVLQRNLDSARTAVTGDLLAAIAGEMDESDAILRKLLAAMMNNSKNMPLENGAGGGT